MPVDAFDSLVASSDMRSSPAPEGGWLDNRDGDRVVNCAAILSNCRYGGGAVTKHYQAKRHPYSNEQAVLATGRYVLLFSEAMTTSCEPLDFAVQICSDFVNRIAVSDLREGLAERDNRARLDFLFILQWNLNQRAWAYAQRLDEFYTPATGLSCGAQTAILFVNNASEVHRRARELGGSSLMVRINEKFRGPERQPCCTYYEFFPGPPHSFQTLVLREDGPSFQYLERLRPYATSTEHRAKKATIQSEGENVHGLTRPNPDHISRSFLKLVAGSWMSGTWIGRN